MPRFYFHLHDDLDATDAEGIELPNLDAARNHALRDVRSTAAEMIQETGRIGLQH